MTRGGNMSRCGESIFSKRLYELRKKKKLTRVQLAEMAKISDRSIINYEFGTRLPNSLDIVKRLAKALDTTTINLAGEDLAIYTDDFKKKNPGSSVMDISADVLAVASAFRGDILSEADKDEMMASISMAYWETKRMGKTEA